MSSAPRRKLGFFSNIIHHIRTSKFLTLFLILYTVAFVMGARQITVLITLPPGSGSDPTNAKRGTSNLPPDLALTQNWLISILGGTVNPGMAMVFLLIWIGLGIAMFGVLFNAICENVDRPPKVLTEEKEEARAGKWYRGGPKKMSIALWRGSRSLLVGTAKVILLDRDPSVGRLWRASGWWTLLRILIFFAQLSFAIILLRQSVALAALVAVPFSPPDGYDIEQTRSWLENTARTTSIEGAMLMVISVIGASILIIAVGWFSLLHPRQKNKNGGAKATMGRMFKFKLSRGAYRVLEVLVGIVLIMVFGFCVIYFAEIIAYTSSIDFVQQHNSIAKSIGLIGASLIFGLFALPLAWVYLKIEKLVLRVFRRRSSTPRQANPGRG
jgi:hypothetical protein